MNMALTFPAYHTDRSWLSSGGKSHMAPHGIARYTGDAHMRGLYCMCHHRLEYLQCMEVPHLKEIYQLNLVSNPISPNNRPFAAAGHMA